MENKQAIRKVRNVCPRNCPSSCTMTSYIEHEQLVHITGDPTHPYTNGKLCAKGFSYIEQNKHPDRLKYPYYQRIKGSGNFQQISWETAYHFITNELRHMAQTYDSFLPFALYKGTGNIGLHHHVTDTFFSSLNETTRIIGSSSLQNSHRIYDGLQLAKQLNPANLVSSSLILIWGANPVHSNLHLIPFLIEAKMKGAKVVVIDPLYTGTVEFADLFIQLRPNTDDLLAMMLAKSLLFSNEYDAAFMQQHTEGFEHYMETLAEWDCEEVLRECDLSSEVFNTLVHWLKTEKHASYVIGTGLQKHRDWKSHLFAIEALAVIRGDVGQAKGGLFFQSNEMNVFNSFAYPEMNESNRIVYCNELTQYLPPGDPLPIHMLWISCGNPLIQEESPSTFKDFMKSLPFVVTVERFMTPTALMSNLILPTTTHFEENDVVISNWHGGMAVNEQALSPYFESRSEWRMMTDLAKELCKTNDVSCSFPILPSENDYLASQFNKKVSEAYGIENLDELKENVNWPPLPKLHEQPPFQDVHSEPYHFPSIEQMKGKLHRRGPTKDFPFWLITPHHPYTLNSQFHSLELMEEKEACISLHPRVAHALGIVQGEVVKVYNGYGVIELAVILNQSLPRDIAMIYQGWYPRSDVRINTLVSDWQADHSKPNHGVAFYDTYVNIKKL